MCLKLGACLPDPRRAWPALQCAAWEASSTVILVLLDGVSNLLSVSMAALRVVDVAEVTDGEPALSSVMNVLEDLASTAGQGQTGHRVVDATVVSFVAATALAWDPTGSRLAVSFGLRAGAGAGTEGGDPAVAADAALVVGLYSVSGLDITLR